MIKTADQIYPGDLIAADCRIEWQYVAGIETDGQTVAFSLMRNNIHTTWTLRADDTLLVRN